MMTKCTIFSRTELWHFVSIHTVSSDGGFAFNFCVKTTQVDLSVVNSLAPFFPYSLSLILFKVGILKEPKKIYIKAIRHSFHRKLPQFYRIPKNPLNSLFFTQLFPFFSLSFSGLTIRIWQLIWTKKRVKNHVCMFACIQIKLSNARAS